MVNTGVELDPGLEDANFVQVLRRRAREDSEAAAFGFLSDTDSETRLTYGELDRRARAVGAALQRLGAAGQRVLLVHPPGVEFVVGFLGCLYGGAVAVPVYPPRPGKDGRDQQRLRAVVRSARPKVVLGTSALLAGFREDGTSGSPELQRLASDALEPGLEEAWAEPRAEPGSLALLQYTSGSTGEPKGVMLSHGNLLHDSRLIRDAFGHTRQSRGVIWLPPYHDMGLIGGILQPLYAGFPVTLMSPVAFLQRPLRWLQAISRLGATTSGGPNFAYELCLRKVTAEQRAGLDLSHWDVAFCGAEPVRRDTLERFAEVFAPCGFRREAFFPCYGLAEATLIVSGGVKGTAPRALPLDPSALERHRVVETADPEARHLVGCGRPLADVAIVDPESGRARGPDEVGEIWVRGAGVAAGYFERPDESRATFGATRTDTGEGPWLRTGDLGFLAEGQLFVSGRLKDLIILRGRNHYPQDLEATASGCEAALGADACAAFAVEREGEERLAIAVELPPRHLAALRRARDEDGAAADPFTALCRRLRAAVVAAHEVEADEVILLEPGGLPRTTSGKVRRRACREGLLAGTLPIVSRLAR
ncbi:MAG TPA: fatty acyl-AMP ligase, partial [Longimicrobium sp.]|nr:fatty acyl-AMP ligase [Longimicrobium sp.]